MSGKTEQRPALPRPAVALQPARLPRRAAPAQSRGARAAAGSAGATGCDAAWLARLRRERPHGCGQPRTWRRGSAGARTGGRQRVCRGRRAALQQRPRSRAPGAAAGCGCACAPNGPAAQQLVHARFAAGGQRRGARSGRRCAALPLTCNCGAMEGRQGGALCRRCARASRDSGPAWGVLADQPVGLRCVGQGAQQLPAQDRHPARGSRSPADCMLLPSERGCSVHAGARPCW